MQPLRDADLVEGSIMMNNFGVVAALAGLAAARGWAATQDAAKMAYIVVPAFSSQGQHLGRIPTPRPPQNLADGSPENHGSLKLEQGDASRGPRHHWEGPMNRSRFSEEQIAYAPR
jgi:hypothetical protein